MASSNGDQKLYELKHDPKPGYGMAFAISFAVMALYLALILVSSHGPAKSHGHGNEKQSPAIDTANGHAAEKSN